MIVQNAGVKISAMKPLISSTDHTSSDYCVVFWMLYDALPEVTELVRTTYDGPLCLAPGMTVWNVTDEQVVVREAITDPTLKTRLSRSSEKNLA